MYLFKTFSPACWRRLHSHHVPGVLAKSVFS